MVINEVKRLLLMTQTILKIFFSFALRSPKALIKKILKTIMKIALNTKAVCEIK